MPHSPSHPSTDDEAIVARHLAGDPEAFAEIVTRHQSAVCAVAYSACGDVRRSEEIAHEVFVSAWRSFGSLREGTKLKAWLCGITRNLAAAAGRRAQRHTHAPESEALQVADASPGPRERAITTEQTALLWQVLAELPETYREPLVLYYREGQSCAAVAAALEVSEEVVRQRLARGRAMVGERITVVVEETLSDTGPRRSFTQSVLAAIPAGAAAGKAVWVKAAASAGSAGGVAAKTGFGAKALGALAAFPVVALLLPSYIELRLEARQQGYRELSRRFLKIFVVILGVNALVLAVFGLTQWPQPFTTEHPGWFITALFVVIAVPVITVGLWQFQVARARRTAPVKRPVSFEYRSATMWLGQPLIHVSLGPKAGPARGWIAIGGLAYGRICAIGGCAFGPVSVGGVAIGLLSYGGVALAAVAIGGMATGIAAIGGMAAGWVARGGMAVGWLAYGGEAYSLNPDPAAVANSPARAWLQDGSEWLDRSNLAWAWASLALMVLAVWEYWRARRATPS